MQIHPPAFKWQLEWHTVGLGH